MGSPWWRRWRWCWRRPAKVPLWLPRYFVFMTRASSLIARRAQGDGAARVAARGRAGFRVAPMRACARHAIQGARREVAQTVVQQSWSGQHRRVCRSTSSLSATRRAARHTRSRRRVHTLGRSVRLHAAPDGRDEPAPRSGSRASTMCGGGAEPQFAAARKLVTASRHALRTERIGRWRWDRARSGLADAIRAHGLR